MMDRYLSLGSVSKKKLLEIALASIRVASKWSEAQPITMVSEETGGFQWLISNDNKKEAVSLSGGKWTTQGVVEAERELLQKLDWTLNAPCILENAIEIVEHFLSKSSTSLIAAEQIRTASKEISRAAASGIDQVLQFRDHRLTH